MNQVKLSVKPSRNGFDMSFKNNFTSKVGEIRPCFLKPVIPGDKWSIDIKSFTRLQPVNTAAFARMREYYDFYFVPMEIIWNRFNDMITQMKSNLQHASGPLLTDNVAPSGDIPYITCEQIAEYLKDVKAVSHACNNLFGYDRATLTCILLEYLGYGNFYKYLEDGVTWSTHPMVNNLKLSILPLLAYQHVYADYFRFTQWERTNPSTFNIDYVKGTNDLNVDLSQSSFINNYNFLDLRYSNFNKDMFLGVLPNSQYGEESSVDLGGTSSGAIPFKVGATNAIGLKNDLPLQTYNVSGAGTSATADVQAVVSGSTSLPLNLLISSSVNRLSILALRQAEAMQRWKEVSQSVDEDYKSQIQAQWGVSVSDFLSHQSRYLGGTAASLDINPVVNQNITGDNNAEIAGIGTVVNNGRINFESKGEYGYIIGVYHSVPLFDYQSDMVDSTVTDTNVLDFPIPAFDKIGMESLPSYLLSNPAYSKSDTESPEYIVSEFLKAQPYLGYVPRYVTWKTSIDVARGAFTKSLKNWVVPFDVSLMEQLLIQMGNNNAINDGSDNANVSSTAMVTWSFFKVNPAVMDTLFAVNADSTVDTDQLLISSFFDAKVVRNLDVNGLPY